MASLFYLGLLILVQLKTGSYSKLIPRYSRKYSLGKTFDLSHPLLSWTTLLSHTLLVHTVYGDRYYMGEILEFSAVYGIH